MNNFEVSINSDVDVGEDDTYVAAGDGDIEFGRSNTLDEESDIDDDERFVSGLCIFEKLVTSRFL